MEWSIFVKLQFAIDTGWGGVLGDVSTELDSSDDSVLMQPGI